MRWTSAILGTLVVANSLPGQSSAEKLLYPAPVLSEPTVPLAFTPGDFDSDGIVDLVGRRKPAPGVAVLPGIGNGAFGPPIETAHAQWFNIHRAADLDGDGALDLLGTDSSSASTGAFVFTAMGMGDGTFGPVQSIAILDQAQGLDFGDVDGDGDLDIAVGAGDYSSGSDAVTVALGLGNGGFVVGQNVLMGDYPAGVVLADFDGDGSADMAACNGQDFSVMFVPSTVHVALGAGNGSFVPTGSATVASKPFSIAAADLNGDGWVDLATTSSDQPVVSLLLGTGGGAFQGAVSIAAGTPSNSILAADLDLDGRADLAHGTAYPVYYAVTILRGLPDGGLSAPESYAGRGHGVSGPTDINGDGRPDLITGNGDSVIVLLGEADGGFDAGTPVALASGAVAGGATPPYVDDFDGDGRLDVVASVNGMLNALLGSGDGSVAAGPTVQLGGNVLATGDLDGDGKPDLVSASPFGVRPWIAQDGAVFAPGSASAVGAGCMRGELADMNGDGALDAVVPANLSQGVGVVLGNGDGTLAPSGSLYGLGRWYEVAVTGDFDTDGDLDVAAIERTPFGGVFLLTNTGGGAMQPGAAVALPFTADVAALDYDVDGALDLAVAGGTDALLFGGGSGGLSPPRPLVTTGDVLTLAFGDLNGDGELDLASDAAPSAYWLSLDAVSVWFGKGSLPFGPLVRFSGAGVPRAGDFDGDGRADLAVVRADGAYAHVLVNRAAAPLVGSIGGLAAATSGQAIVTGAGFDATTQVAIDGVAITPLVVGPTQLALPLGPSEPGLADVDVTGTFGTTSVEKGLQRWPALDSGPAQVGLPLSLTLSNGGPGLYALAVSGSVLPGPIPIPGIYHGVWLNPVILLKVGVIAVGQTSAAHVVVVPPDPGLSGAILYFQGWAQQDGQPVVPPTSFSNHHRVTIQ